MPSMQSLQISIIKCLFCMWSPAQWCQCPPLHRLSYCSRLLSDQTSMPNNASVLHCWPHWCFVESEEGLAGSAGSLQHGRGVQSPAGIGTCIMWPCQLRSLETITPSTLVQVVFPSSFPSMVSGRISSGGYAFWKDTNRKNNSLYIHLGWNCCQQLPCSLCDLWIFHFIPNTFHSASVACKEI